MGKQEKAGSKVSKEMVQSKLTSIYGKNALSTNTCSKSSRIWQSNSSEDCMIVEKPQLHANRGHVTSSFLRAEGEERTFGNKLGTKRVHMEISSPRIGNAKSPSSNDEVSPDVCGNGFVTARAKLVSTSFFFRC